MKVLHVIPSVAPRYGGPSQAIVEMCRALIDEGVEVVIATTNADGERRLEVELGTLTSYQDLPTIFFSRQFTEAFKYSYGLASWLNRNVNSFDVAHIHAIFSHSSITAARACIRRNIPYVVQPHGSLDPWSLKQRRCAKAFLWRAGVKRMLCGAAAVDYTLEQEKRLAENSLGINSGVVVPLGVTQQNAAGESLNFRATVPSLEHSPYVLLLSRIHRKKNIEALLDAFSRVTALTCNQHWKLVIAGDGDARYVGSLKRLAQRSCGEKVIFTGWLEGAEKAAALKDAALFALPSHQENFGLSVAEAMVWGVPVLISTHVNLADEIASKRAGWVVDLEGGSLRQALGEAVSNEVERAQRGAAAKALARSRYSWPAVAKALVHLYRQVQLSQN
jgi:glycosyltransferase involved in cell wall biosynthesis